MEQNIQVFVRCRPLKPNEKQSHVDVMADTSEVKINDNKSFYFDKVFDTNSDQQAVYTSIVRPLINQVLQGYNCTVFAYGQTGTGKTYTMEGGRPTENLGWEHDPHSGIIPRAISQLFDTLQVYDGEFSVRVTFLELYNEDTYDLLSPIDDTTKLKIFDDSQRKGCVIVDGLEEILVQSKAQIYDILKRGSAKRQTAATLLNACSSRSHTIFTITVQAQDDEVTRTGKLNLVDLAGSENIARSGLQNKHAREAGNINQSLLTLTRVITALVEKRPHIPYRESKLTRILQDSIGGNAKTSMIATISMAEEDIGNTMGTLDYASRARRITNKLDRQLQRKPSDLDLEAFKSELEFNIRNEVALEFQRETDKIREVYKKENADLRDTIKNIGSAKDLEIARLQETIKNIESAKDLDFAELQESAKNIACAKDLKIAELQESAKSITCAKDLEIARLLESIKNIESVKDLEIAELNERIKKITGELEQLRSEKEKVKPAKEKDDEVSNGDVVQRLLYERIQECENFKAEREELKRNLDECTCKRQKKVQRIRKEAPIDEEDEVHEYANMTFDNDDEIIQVSARKPKSQLAGRKNVRKELTMSGKKKRLRPTDDDEVSLSPISPPVRVTRARATRRKLAY